MVQSVCSLSIVLAVAAAATGQTTVYQTGFEGPPFAIGSTLAGVEGWLVQSTPPTPMFAIAQASQSNGGLQGAELQSSLVTGSSWAWKNVAFNPTLSGTPFVTVTWDMNISTTGTVVQAGVDFYSATPYGRLASVGVNSGETVNYLLPPAAVFVNTPVNAPRGQWHSFRAVFDFGTHTLDLFLNGAAVASDLPFVAGTDFGDADLWKGGPGTAHIYYDNFRIVADDAPGCYPDCTGDGQLTVQDFGCYQTKFVQGDPYADCTGDGNLTVQDFGCYQTRFVQGCP